MFVDLKFLCPREFTYFSTSEKNFCRILIGLVAKVVEIATLDVYLIFAASSNLLLLNICIIIHHFTLFKFISLNIFLLFSRLSMFVFFVFMHLNNPIINDF